MEDCNRILVLSLPYTKRKMYCSVINYMEYCSILPFTKYSGKILSMRQISENWVSIPPISAHQTDHHLNSVPYQNNEALCQIVHTNLGLRTK